MSLRAELVRLCLPWFMRPRFPSDVQIEYVRRRMTRFGHLIPPPPRGTEVIAADVGGVKAERITTPRSLHNRYLLHLHGGAYLFGFPALFRDFTWRIADAASARVLCIDYRLAPENAFPAAIEDATAAYRGLIAESVEPRQVAFIGDSSGGGLALASMMRLRDEGSPLPAAAVVLSPWTDLALTGQSLTQYDSDPMVPVELMRGRSRLISPAPIRARLTPLRSTVIRQAYRRRSSMLAVMRHCATTRCGWPSACDQPAARSNSKCGRACSMSGICSRASSQSTRSDRGNWCVSASQVVMIRRPEHDGNEIARGLMLSSSMMMASKGGLKISHKARGLTMTISVDGDLREQLEARERWWRDQYAELWEQDLVPAVKAWASVQYHRIQKKERARVRRALVNMAFNGQADAAHKSGSEQDPRGADTSARKPDCEP